MDHMSPLRRLVDLQPRRTRPMDTTILYILAAIALLLLIVYLIRRL